MLRGGSGSSGKKPTKPQSLDSSNGASLLKDLEAISNALAISNPPKRLKSPSSSSAPDASRPRSSSVGRKTPPPPPTAPHAPSAVRKWWPFKALSHIGHRKFDVRFTLCVHSIKGLSSEFNGRSLCVQWRRAGSGTFSRTRAVRVLRGVAEFGDSLEENCHVYGSRSGHPNSIKYEPKQFVVGPAVVGEVEGRMVLGEHRVDLTKGLPTSLQELGDDNCTGEWNCTFKLTGKGKGAVMNVRFGFTLVKEGRQLDGDRAGSLEGSSRKMEDVEVEERFLRRTESLSGIGNLPKDEMDIVGRNAGDTKVVEEVVPASDLEVVNVYNVEEVLGGMECEEVSGVIFDDVKPLLEAISNEVRTVGRAEEHKPLCINENEKTEGVEVSDIDPQKKLEKVDFLVFGGQRVSENSEILKVDEKKKSEDVEMLEVDSQKKSDGFSALQVDSQEILEDYVEVCSPNAVEDKEIEVPEFTVIEQGMEIARGEELKVDADKESDEVDATVNRICVDSREGDEDEVLLEDGLASTEAGKEMFSDENDLFTRDDISEQHAPVGESSVELLDSAFHELAILEKEALVDYSQVKLENPSLSEYTEAKPNYESGRLSKSLSFDEVTESVANEFLTLLGLDQSSSLGLGSDSDPESPREKLLNQFSKDDAWKQFEKDSSSDMESPKERLWRQFQKECPSISGGILCPDTGSEKESDWDEESDFDSSLRAEKPKQEKSKQEIISRERAKLLEDAEAVALMRKMGLNEKTFQSSPPIRKYGFGSPIDFPCQDPLELPPLADGLGPFIQTKDGGFLRTMSPSLFKNAKNSGSLIMQVSSPIVLPAELGSGVMDILQGLASIGIEKLSLQANKLMPLEDVTGKSMRQVAWEALPSLEANESLSSDFGGNGFSGADWTGSRSDDFGYTRSTNMGYSRSDDIGSEYVSLEDLAPLAMDKIEALSIEGLRIQSGMSEGDAPCNISTQSLGEISALEGKGSSSINTLGLEGAGGLQLLDVKNTGDEVDGLMSLSLTLDEWMRLDSGMVDEDVASERTTKILAAHHAKSADLVGGVWNGERRGGKGSGKRCGLLGNNFTVALMVQLRDPMRDYEPVGTPMLSLIQVERVFVPPKPRIYCTVSVRGNSEEYDEEPEKKPEIKPPLLKEEVEEVPIPQFKITEVHVAGLKHEPSSKKTWGNPFQQSSGSRWLLASGMGKNSKHPFMKSKTVNKPSQSTTTVQPGETLWSISSRIHGSGEKWKELADLNPHIRNPNVIFPNQTIRLR